MIRRSIMNKLKYGIILTAVLFAQSVLANTTQTTIQVESYVTNVQPLQQETRKIVKPVKSCSIVEVPIYGTTGGAQTGEVLGGAIIGGILGNQVGGGSGKDAATILGAILGADIANKKGGKKVIIGYKQVEQCDIINQVEYQNLPAKYRVTVKVPTMQNVEHVFITTDPLSINSRVDVYVAISIRVKDF